MSPVNPLVTLLMRSGVSGETTLMTTASLAGSGEPGESADEPDESAGEPGESVGQPGESAGESGGESGESRLLTQVGLISFWV